MNGQVEVTWKTLQTISHSLMIQARVLDKYIKFSLMYTNHQIFLVLPIMHLVNQNGEPTTQHKLATGTKLSLSNFFILLLPCVVRNETAHVNRKALNMSHQPKKGFWGIFIGIPQNQKGYLIYIPSTRKIISSHNIVFDGKNLVRYNTHHIYPWR